jgi:hypothetical protein
MKQSTLFIVCLAMSLLILPACKKGGGGGGTPDPPPPPPPTEADLVVTLNPANGSVQAPALGPFNLTVTVTSTMPTNGVKIEVSAKKDDGSGSAAYYSTSVNSTTSINNFTITNTPPGVQCLVDVKVTSLTKPTNIWTGSYRYSSK